MSRNATRARAWMWAPVAAVAAIVVAEFGLLLYFHGGSPAPFGYWFPFFPFFFIPVFFLIFIGFRWFFWGGWGWWGRGWYCREGYYDPAVETLRERFARGEITRDQLSQMLSDLSPDGQPQGRRD